MSLVAIREINKGRGGGITREGDTEYIRTFLAKTDNPEDNAATLLAFGQASGALPQWLSIFSAGGMTDLTARVKDIRCVPRSDDSPYWWDITVKYDSQTERGEKLDNPEGTPEDDNPLNRPPGERWETLRTTDIRQFDLSIPPQEFTNSAGQLYSEGLEVEVVYPVLVITRNEPTPPDDGVMTYVNSINDDLWKGRDRYQWKVVDISSAEGQEDIAGFTVFYDQVRYSFALNSDPDGWQYKVLDKGPFQLRFNQVKQIQEPEYRRDTAGAIIEKDQLLNGGGAFLLLNRGGQLAGGQRPSFRRFFRNPLRTFANLRL